MTEGNREAPGVPSWEAAGFWTCYGGWCCDVDVVSVMTVM